ncbi:hypothetical protein GCM10028784_03420 [Myceligenerans cantabricum]
MQYAARRLRPELLEQGVVYPGRGDNHHKGTSWLAGLDVTYLADPTPQEEWWRNLEKDLVDLPDHRALISFEMICTTDLDGARHTVDEVGAGGERPVHVVLVLRNLGGFVPSYWQESLKRGNTRTLDSYLRAALADPAAVASSGAFHRRDGMGLLERWSDVVGPENVTVVVLEKEHPARLLDTFEELLDLRAGLLHSKPVKGSGANRGMSPAEAALVLQLNRKILGKWKSPRREHRALVFKGAVDRLLAKRTPTDAEGSLKIPHWAADACVEAGTLLADSVRSSGVRVIGDLGELERAVPSTDRDSSEPPAELPFDVALESLLGMYAKSTGWDAQHAKKTPATTEPQAAERAEQELTQAKAEITRLTAELEALREKEKRPLYRTLLRTPHSR